MAAVITKTDRDPTAIDSAGSRWLRIWFLVLVLFCALLGSIEAGWRLAGHRPNVVDTPALWAWHRRQVDRSGGNGVVLLGTSRMLDGFSTKVFRRRFPRIPITQLAIMECSSVKLLREFAADPNFHGRVICEMPEGMLLTAATERYSKLEITGAFRHAPPWTTEVENEVDWRLQDKLCSRNPQFALRRTLKSLLGADSWPEPEMGAMRFDRSRLIRHRNQAVLEAHRDATVGYMHRWLAQNLREPVTPDGWLKQALQVEPAVEQIQAKGGQVAFVMFPCSGESWALEERWFPKENFWDRFAARTKAVTIHFRDVPALANTVTPDTGHIDEAHADQFTNGLVDELIAKRGLPTADERN